MSIKLRELIRNVRACKTMAEERAVIAKECALIRTAFKEEDTGFRHRNVAKLLFIHMLGYPSHFGQMECLKLIASPLFPEKRIGYLGLMLLLTEKEEVLTLVTNSLKNDLNHNSPFVIGLSLTAIGNCASPDMARDLLPDIDKHLRGDNNYLRKKASLAAIRVFKKVPELIEDFLERIASLVKDRSHGVLITGVQLMIEVVLIDQVWAEPFQRLVPNLVRLLRNLLSMGYAPEHDVSGIADPFLQVKLLHVLRLLGRKNAETSDAMNDILAQVATNTETAKNAGNAILYECVQTIMQIESEGGLRVLAVNILGRFLLNRDNNIRYVALNTLSKVVSEDVQAVQRHRNTIVDCLKDPDVSIRTRALELIYALANESNIRTLAREMLNYLVVCNADLKPDLCSKIADVVDRFAPSKRWQIDTLITTLSIAGNNLQNNNITSSLICLIAQCTQLHSYIVHKLFQAIQDDMTQQALVHVSIWCCGEYGQLLLQAPPQDENLKDGTAAASSSQIIDVISKAMRIHSATELTKSFCLNALLKLTTRLQDPSVDARLLKLIGTYQHSMKLELQQRSVEYKTLLQPEWASLKSEVLAQMPMIDEEKMRQRHGALKGGRSAKFDDDDDDDEAVSSGVAGMSIGSAAPAAAAPAVQKDLLDLDDIFGANPAPAPAMGAPAGAAAAAPANDLLSDIFAAPAAPLQPAGAPPMGGGGLLDLMGGPATPAMAVQQPMMPVAAPAAPAAPAGLQVYDKNGLAIAFSLAPNGQTTTITATFLNSTAAPMTGLLFQCAVPKYITLQMSPASSSEVPPNRQPGTSQVVTIVNTMQGSKSVMMRMKIQFTQNGQVFDDMAQVSNFPPNL